MKATFSPSSQITFEVEGENQKEVFSALARLQEVFSITSCGKCGGKDIRYVKRVVDDNAYYEMQCLKCHARLSFGQHKKNNTLFPKRKDENNNWLADGGWLKWDPESKTNI